jgi:hypothetical protein
MISIFLNFLNFFEFFFLFPFSTQQNSLVYFPIVTFTITTLKGSKGSIEVPTDATVADLYKQVQDVLGWADEETDYYVIILQGKKLIDFAQKIAIFNPNPVKSQIVVTKAAKPQPKLNVPGAAVPVPVVVQTPVVTSTPATVSPAPAPTPANSMNDTDPTPSTTTKTPIISQPAPVTTTVTPQTTPNTTTTTTSTTSTTSTSAIPPTTAETMNDTDTTTTDNNANADIANTRGANFIHPLRSEKNLRRFFEVLDSVNADLSTSLANTDRYKFAACLEMLTRASYIGGDSEKYNPLVHAQVLDQRAPVVSRGKGRGRVAQGNATGPTAEQRAQLARQKLEEGMTDQDKANISSLMELGFSRERVLQAYIVCDKNVEITASYLFQQMD